MIGFNLRQSLELAWSLWKSGLPRVTPRQALRILGARWRCGNSFALLSAVAAIRFPDRVALRDDDGEMTFGELHWASVGLAAHIRSEHGVGGGTQVALVARNHRSFVLGLLAATRLGADVLPMAPDLPAAVMETILQRQGISLVLHDPALVDGLSPVVALVPCVAPATRGEKDLERVEGGRGGELVVLTSGSSGISKGIRRRPTLGQVVPLVTGLLRSLPLRMHRPVVLAIPLYHGYGIATLAMALALGSPLELGRRYEISALLGRLLPDERPMLVTVPTLLSRWLKSGDVGEVVPEAVITGSAPLSAELCTALLDALGPVVYNLYGSTEAGLIALASPRTLRDAPGCVGSPLPGNTVRLLGPDGREVPPGQVGRIFVRGPFVLPSGDLSQEGWRETGDLGRVDPGGRLHVCGRSDSMVVSGGENVYPHEIEEVLAGHPAVMDAAVLVVDDEEFGCRMMAVVALGSAADVGEEALAEWLKGRLERHKRPRAVCVVERIPRNALGKVDRPALRGLLGLEEGHSPV